jgi:HEAT repeat protein
LSAATGVGACIAAALADPEPSVVEAAVMVAGESGLADLRPPLLALAGKPNAPVTLRAEAVVALARLGDPAPAERILQTHRAKGGIEPLALGAIRAFIELNDPEHTGQLVDLTEKSKSAAVRMAATEALLALQPDTAEVLLKRRIAQARDPGERRQLETLRDRRGAALEPVPEDSPREDDEPD